MLNHLTIWLIEYRQRKSKHSIKGKIRDLEVLDNIKLKHHKENEEMLGDKIEPERKIVKPPANRGSMCKTNKLEKYSSDVATLKCIKNYANP